MVQPAELGIDLLYPLLRDAVVVGEAQSGRIVLWNPAAEALFGYAVDEAIGMPLELLLPERLRSAYRAEFARFAELGTDPLLPTGPTGEIPAIHKDGRELVVELSLTPLREARPPGRYVLAIVRDVTRRVHLEETLRHSEARLAQAQATAQLGSWEWDIATDTVTWSNQLCRIFGLTSGAIAGAYEDYLARIHPADRELVTATIGHSLETGESFTFEHRIVLPDGRVRVLHGAGDVAIGEDGCPVRMHGVAQDITDRKQTEEALLRERDLLRALMDNLPDPVYFKDVQHRFTRVNQAAAALYGLDDPAQAIGKTDFDVFPEEQARQFWADERPVLEEARPLLNRLERQAGESGWTLATKVPIIDDAGQVTGLVGISRDITDLAQAEAALRQSEAQFRSAFTHAAIGMALVGLDGRFLQVNDALCRLSGYAEPELLTKTFQDITHPDDLDLDLAYVGRLLADEIRSYTMEKRYFARDGSIVWILLSVSLVRDEGGEPLHFISQIEDITPRKEAEAALRESEERFHSAFDDSAVGMSLIAPDGRLIQANPALREMLGYTADEIDGTTIAAATHPDDLAVDLEQMTRLFAGELDSYRLKKRIVRKDGGIIWGYLTRAAVRGPDGAVRYAIAQIQDITEQELAEQENRRLQAELDAELGRAAAIQAQLLPTEPPLVPGYQIAGVCQPARHVGGDFFDWHLFPGGVDISLADVMGKGMSAALLMATGRTAVRTLADLPPAAMMESINRVVFPDLVHSDSFITLFHLHLDAPSGSLTYADAGHGMAFIQRRDGRVERFSHRGVPLGVLPDATYAEGADRLESGDTLVIYSDGLPDARPELELDLAGIAAQIRGLPDAQEMLDHLVALARGGSSLPDDLTLIVLRRE